MAEREPVPAALCELPGSASEVFLTLRDSETKLTISELSERLRTSRKTVRRRLRDLQEAGLVDRVGHPTDGRRCRWALARDEPAATSGVSREECV